MEGFSNVVKHGVAITKPPPQLPKKQVSWSDNYNRYAHDIHHVNVLTNAFPMGKPPALLEDTMGDVQVDVARPQFVPKMAKR